MRLKTRAWLELLLMKWMGSRKKVHFLAHDYQVISSFGDSFECIHCGRLGHIDQQCLVSAYCLLFCSLSFQPHRTSHALSRTNAFIKFFCYQLQLNLIHGGIDVTPCTVCYCQCWAMYSSTILARSSFHARAFSGVTLSKPQRFHNVSF